MSNKYDLIFSIGPYCRPAYYLELSGIRKCAYPFDWLGISLNTILDLFINGFDNFFKKYNEEENRIDARYRTVIDGNKIISPHHISLDIPLDDGVEIFRKLMAKRFKRLKMKIENSTTICMLTNQYLSLEELIKFIETFGTLYSDKKIDLINIRNSKKEYQKEILLSDNLKFIEFGFHDINNLGDNPNTNSNFWLGNEDKWLEIMEYINRKEDKNEQISNCGITR